MVDKFLLQSKTAKRLYQKVKSLPIIDYHNHLSMGNLSNDERFLDVYELWVGIDPYKHRAMRMLGVDEKYITGDATNKEKFIKWAESLPKLTLNPLSHWSMMELDKIFCIKEPLNGDNAERIYDFCNDYLSKNVVTATSLLSLFNVEYACPCASIIDDISFYYDNQKLSPSLRGDDMVAVTKSFIEKLQKVSGEKIENLNDFESAIEKRIIEFKKAGCKFSDHALDDGFIYYVDDQKNCERFDSLINGDIKKEDSDRLSSYILTVLSSLYAKHGFIMQLHIGAKRSTSSRLKEKVGPFGGFAGIGNSVSVSSLTTFLDKVEKTEYGLPKILLFTLNPSDNALISVLSGSYSKDGVKGLITQGPAWWWCDHKLGMEQMFENASVFGVLSNFIGMTTDSRSFLSFIRHDYFRRVLCNWLADKFDKGEMLLDMKDLKNLASDLCYYNAKREI